MDARAQAKMDQMLLLIGQDNGAGIFIHLDPRREGVSVPERFVNEPRLVLHIGLKLAKPVIDLDVDEEGVRCTLSFSERPFLCVIPWSAVFALATQAGGITTWPQDVPREFGGPTTARDITEGCRRAPPRERQPGEPTRRRISAVPSSPSPSDVPPRSERATEPPPSSSGARPKLRLVK